MKYKLNVLIIILVFLLFLFLSLVTYEKFFGEQKNNNEIEEVNNENTDANMYSDYIINTVTSSIVMYDNGVDKLYLEIDDNKNLIVSLNSDKKYSIKNFSEKIKNLKLISGCSIETSDIAILTEEGNLYYGSLGNEEIPDISKYESLYNNLINSDDIMSVDMVLPQKIESDDKIESFTTLIDGVASCGNSGFYVSTDKGEIKRVENNKLTIRWDGHIADIGDLSPEIFVYSDNTVKFNENNLVKVIDENNIEYKIDKVIYEGPISSETITYFITKNQKLISVSGISYDILETQVVADIYNDKKIDNIEIQDKNSKDIALVTFEDGTFIEISGLNDKKIIVIDDLIN